MISQNQNQLSNGKREGRRIGLPVAGFLSVMVSAILTLSTPTRSPQNARCHRYLPKPSTKAQPWGGHLCRLGTRLSQTRSRFSAKHRHSHLPERRYDDLQNKGKPKIVSAFLQTISISTLSKWSVFNFISLLLNVVGTKGNVHGVLHAHPGTVSSSPQPAGQTTEKTLPIRPRQWNHTTVIFKISLAFLLILYCAKNLYSLLA